MPPDDLVLPGADEVRGAVDGDAPAQLVETRRAVEHGGTGLAFGISIDVRPMQAFARALARVLERRASQPTGCRR